MKTRMISISVHFHELLVPLIKLNAVENSLKESGLFRRFKYNMRAISKSPVIIKSTQKYIDLLFPLRTSKRSSHLLATAATAA